MKEITIFTPTYNRANLLTRLYQSLKMQTCREFQWLIVDDGSTDDTKNMVEKFIQDDEIAIWQNQYLLYWSCCKSYMD